MIIIANIEGKTMAWNGDNGWTTPDNAENLDSNDVTALLRHFETNNRQVAVLNSFVEFEGWHMTGMALIK